MLAYPGDRLPGNRNATRLLLVAVFPGVHGSHDGNACADWLDFRDHREYNPCAVDARQLDGLAGGAQPKPRNAGARSDVVCDLCHGFVAACGNCHSDSWQIAGAIPKLALEDARCTTEDAPPRMCSLTFW